MDDFFDELRQELNQAFVDYCHRLESFPWFCLIEAVVVRFAFEFFVS